VRNAVRILLVISAITCYPGPQLVSQTHLAPRQAYCELTPRDYAVYAALMLDLRDPEYLVGAGAKRILILGTTAKPTKSDLTARWTGRNSDSTAVPASDTVADFKVNADSRCSIKPEFDDPQSYDIVGSEDVDALFTKHAPLRYLGWEEFYKKYPNYAGYWTFSRPGYNRRGDEAVLYVMHACGPRCGTGHLYFLSRQNDQWTVKNRLMLWLS
jgi:hypothetical protein